MDYILVKSLHLLFVIAWMACVFYLPRILVNIVEAGDVPAVRERLLLMARRLYRFGHVMFALMLLPGLALWMYFGVQGGWLHAKLGIVALLFIYFLGCGIAMKRCAAGGSLPSAKALRLLNELPVLLLFAVIWLVLAKPF